MKNVNFIITGVLLVVWLFFVLRVYLREKKNKEDSLGIKFMVRVGIFGAIAAVLYIFVKFPIPIFPPFMEIHFDEIPILISGFAYGPLAGMAVIFLKTFIKLPFTSTLGVGEICDLLYSMAFVIPASMIYQKHRTIKGALVSLLVGTLCQITAALFGNMNLILPFYMQIMEFSEAAILGMCQKANPNITDLKWTYGLFAVIPFNAIKDAMIVILTMLVYKSTHKIIDRIVK